MIPEIPQNEIEVIFSRSSGPGGQNVNKTSTKVMVIWNVVESLFFSQEQKNLIISRHRSEVLRVINQETRSQPENRKRAIKKLNDMVKIALIVEKDRIPTKPSLASRLKQVFLKKQKAKIKMNRKKPIQEE